MTNIAFDPVAFLGERLAEERFPSDFIMLLNVLGNPERDIRCVHVAGTNGKGSTCAFIERILRERGYSTGLFTSPALFSVNERFMINGEFVDDESLRRAAYQVFLAEQAMGIFFGGFHRMTAVAFLLFSQNNVDYMVLETGLGGRTDPTTAAPCDVSMITRIGLDHSNLLGETIEEIAYEKAAIIKPGQLCAIIHPQEPSVIDILVERCERMNVPLIRVDSVEISPISFNEKLQNFSVKQNMFSYTDRGLRNGEPHRLCHNCVTYLLNTTLLGYYQLENATAAMLAAQALGIDAVTIREGIAKTIWPGRFELLEGDPDVLLDGAHNPQCMEALCESMIEYLPESRYVAIVSIMKDKDWKEMLSILIPKVSALIAIRQGERSIDPGYIVEYAHSEGCTEAFVAKDVASAYKKAKQICDDDDSMSSRILICGSLYLVGEAREYLLNI